MKRVKPATLKAVILAYKAMNHDQKLMFTGAMLRELMEATNKPKTA